MKTKEALEERLDDLKYLASGHLNDNCNSGSDINYHLPILKRYAEEAQEIKQILEFLK